MSNPNMHDRICLVTGATSGIGKATTLALATAGARVILVGRSLEKGESTRAEIVRGSGNDRVDLLVADLSSQQAIRHLAAEIDNRYPHLHVLVNNAGGIWSKRLVTVDGLETTFAVNHLAYFLLTSLLLNLLKASADARVVNVGSAWHSGVINFDDLQSEQSYSMLRAYRQSKLANLLFTYELARRLAGSGVTANAVHPGFVASSFGRHAGWFSYGTVLAKPFGKSPEQGARTSIYLASSPEVDGVSGKYFIDCKETRSS